MIDAYHIIMTAILFLIIWRIVWFSIVFTIEKIKWELPFIFYSMTEVLIGIETMEDYKDHWMPVHLWEKRRKTTEQFEINKQLKQKNMFGSNKKMKDLAEEVKSLINRLNSYEWAFNNTPKYKMGDIVDHIYGEGVIYEIVPHYLEGEHEFIFTYVVTSDRPNYYYGRVKEYQIYGLSKSKTNERKSQKRATKSRPTSGNKKSQKK